MTEAALVRKILAWLREQPETWVMKVHGSPMQVAGIPDLIGVQGGRFFGLEVKLPGGKATLLQDAVMRKIEAAGGVVGVVRSVDEVLALQARMRDLAARDTELRGGT